MTGLLVSVRDVQEAEAALAGGANVIDVKEPAQGPLGAASLETITAVCDFVGERAPVSAACGELLDVPPFPVRHMPHALAFAKIGLAGCRQAPDWKERLLAVWQQFPPGIERVAVAYADWQTCDGLPPERIVEFCATKNCRYLLVDTFDKTKCLTEHVAPLVLQAWFKMAHSSGMQIVLAGSVTLDQLSSVVPSWQPTYVAVRGAACDGNRESCVSQQRVTELRCKLDEISSLRSAPS